MICVIFVQVDEVNDISLHHNSESVTLDFRTRYGYLQAGAEVLKGK